MLVPRPAAVWISNFPSICEALVRMLCNPKPSLFARLALEIPDPLSFTLRMRLGGSQRSLTLTTVGLAWRTALLIASWGKTQQLMLYPRRQTFFRYVGGSEITAQPTRNVRVLNQTLQRRSQS